MENIMKKYSVSTVSLLVGNLCILILSKPLGIWLTFAPSGFSKGIVGMYLSNTEIGKGRNRMNDCIELHTSNPTVAVYSWSIANNFVIDVYC